MLIKCPHCGTKYEVDNDKCGQEADCLECGQMFVVGSDVSLLPTDDPSTHVSSDSTRNKIADYVMKTKIVDYMIKTWCPENEADIDIKCPFCKTAFVAQQGDFGKSHVCKGCNKEFNVPMAYICPNDGNIEWKPFFPLTSFLEKHGWVVVCAAWGFVAWAYLLASDAPAPKIKSLGHLTFFESIVIGVFYVAIRILKTWQGIVGIVLLFSVWTFKDMKNKCEKCEKKLLDVNSPMGWKLYKEIYGNRYNNRTKEC